MAGQNKELLPKPEGEQITTGQTKDTPGRPDMSKDAAILAVFGDHLLHMTDLDDRGETEDAEEE